MKAFKKFLWISSLVVTMLFTSAFAACAGILDSTGSSKEPDVEIPVGITATYEQSAQVFPDTPLDDLRNDLTVLVETSEETTGDTTETDDYTLSGTLAVGESVITVTYNPAPTLTTTFTVLVSEGTAHQHAFTNYVSDNNATCKADGTKTAVCDNGCGETDTIADTGSKLEHVFENYVSDNNATCKADGTKTASCEYGCGESDTVTDTGSKLEHVFENYVSNGDATCKADGTKTASCELGCGETDTVADTGTKLEHVFENYVSNGDATCKADGTKTASCELGCGETNKITDTGTKLEHVFENYVSNNDAKCEADGTKTALCEYDCGEKDTIADENSALGHEYTKYVSDNNATCEEDGTKTASCNHGCGKTDTVTDVKSALGHEYTNYVSDDNATCEADGTKTASCNHGCGKTDTVTDVDSKLGHKYTNYASDNNATCEEDGTKTASCDNGCGTKKTIADVDSKLGHKYTNYVSDGNATCEEDGTKTATCDNGCGTKKTIADVDSKLGHKYTNYVSDGNATCEEDGTKTATCDNGCGTKKTIADVNSKLGHKYTNYVSDNNATCEEDGTKTATCDNGCGTKKTIADENSKLGHEFTNYISNNDATLGKDGTKTASCNHGCGETDTVTDVGSALEHSYTNYVSDGNATCTQDGTKTATCDNGCGTTNTITDVGTKLGHSFENYVSDNNATCEEDGTETAVCDRENCEETDTRKEENSALGHTYVASVTAPTCTEKGYTTHTCACGDSYVDTYVNALGHKYTSYVSDGNATCEKDGTKTATCDNGCGKKDTITDEGSAFGHKYTNYVSDNNATCEEDGTKTASCDNGCGTKKTIADVNSKLGHKYTNYVSDNNATCEEDGTKTASCDNGCGKKDTIADVDSKLGHEYTKYLSDNNATCEEDGTKTASCNHGCGETDTVTDVKSALGHEYTNYASDNNATCTQDGTKTASCNHGCGTTKTITDVDSKLGHEYTNYVSDNNATCEEDGTKTASCDHGCGKKDTVADEGSVLGHSFKLGECERCSATNHISIITAPNVTSAYYGETMTLLDGVVKNELGETVTDGTWSITGVDYTVSGTSKEIKVKAYVTFTPNGTEYAPASKEIEVSLLAVAKYGSNYYVTVDGALAKANASNSGKVYVLPLGSEIDSGRAKIAKTIAVVNEIKSGVTLTLPYVESKLDTAVAYVLVNDNSAYKQTAYGKAEYLCNQLYIAEEHTLTSAGTINVAGEVCGGMHMNYNTSGNANSLTAGCHAQINLGANAKLISTGTVNCYGFINEEEQNNGSEFIVEKGKVTVMFTIVEYRGGQRYFGMIDPSNSKVKEAIAAAAADGLDSTPGKYTPDTLQASPFNRFYIESVTSKTTVKYGAQMIGYVVLWADSDNQETTLNLINNSDAIITLKNQNSSVTYKYDYKTHKTDLDIYGDMKLNPLNLMISITKSESFAETTIELTLTTGATGNSSGVFFPISDYFDVSLNAVNGSATVDASEQKVKLLPGAKLTVGKGVVLNASEIAVYEDNHLFANSADKHYTTDTRAELIIHGTLNVEAIGGVVKVGEDGARLNVIRATSVISKEIKTMAPSKTVEITVTVKVFGLPVSKTALLPYVHVDYSSEEDSTLLAKHKSGALLRGSEFFAQGGKWVSNIVYVDLQLNGGTASIPDQPYNYGDVFNVSQLPVPERDYYNFVGWYTTENFESGTEFTSMTLTEDVTFYAKWELMDGVLLVTFETTSTNANDKAKTQTFASQTIAGTVKNATYPKEATQVNEDAMYDRYVSGYYADKACTIPFDFSQEITQDTTIYVTWAAKIKVSISTGKANASAVVVNGKTVSAPETIGAIKDYYVVPGATVELISKTVAGKQVTITAKYRVNGEYLTTTWSGEESATATMVVEIATTFVIALS